jgi:hypothetical protein
MSIENVKKLETAVNKLCHWDEAMSNEENQKIVNEGCGLLDEVALINDIDVLDRILGYFMEERNDIALDNGVCETIETTIFQYFSVKQLSNVLHPKLFLLVIKNKDRAIRLTEAISIYSDVWWSDGLVAHLMPCKKYLKDHDIDYRNGFAALMYKKQHVKTRTYGKKVVSIPTSAPYRQELAEDLVDYIGILKEDGSWTPEVRQSLQQGLDNFRREFPDLFRKISQ